MHSFIDLFSRIPPNAILGVGPRKPKIALIGEQPGVDEVLQGKPFVGQAGQDLDKCLHNAAITRHEIYISNVIKDLNKPLIHYIKLKKGEPEVSDAGHRYINFLKEELEYVQPNVVIATGNIPLFALCSRTGITKWRGSVIESTLIPGLKVVPTIHPATISPPKNVYLNKHLITFDLRRARKESESPLISLTSRKTIISPSFYDAVGYLQSCLPLPSFDFDTEVVNEEMFCFSIAKSPTEAMSIPLLRGGDYFTVDQEAQILLLLAKLLERPDVEVGGHNLDFDLEFMLVKYGIKFRGRLRDTMIASKITFPDFRKGLDFVVSIHSDIPYYKADGKKWFKLGGPLEQFWAYNAMDSISTAACSPSLLADIKAQQNESTYERHCKLVPILMYMQARGISVDVEGMVKARDVAKEKISTLEQELFSLVGRQINYNSPDQIMSYFYGEKGLKPYVKKKTRQPTADADAMKRISRKGFKEARLIMQLRNLSTKVLGTYLNLDKLSHDGRYRSQYDPVGAATGRLSSSEDIFGKGGNQQNWPHSLLRYLLADKGYVCYSIDLSQAENRIVAYVGRVLPMIEAFETGLDVHRLTAALIFGRQPEEISDEDGSCDIGDGTQSERFWGKKSNHSLNYGEGYREFSLKCEIPEAQGKLIYSSYHSAYPEVKGTYQALIQDMLLKGGVINLLGRRRVFMGRYDQDTFKKAYAQLPQSSVGDIINERGLIYVYYNQSLFRHVELLRQVHDDIGFQIPLPPTVPWLEHARILRAIKASLETPLSWRDREFVIPADITMGFSFTKDKENCVEFKAKNFPSSERELALRLEQSFYRLAGGTNVEDSARLANVIS